MNGLSKTQMVLLSCALLLLVFIGIQQYQSKSTGEGISDDTLFATGSSFGRFLTGNAISDPPTGCKTNPEDNPIRNCNEDSNGLITFEYCAKKQKGKCAEWKWDDRPTMKCVDGTTQNIYDYFCYNGKPPKPQGTRIQRCDRICTETNEECVPEGNSVQCVDTTPGCVPNQCQSGQCGAGIDDGCRGTLDCGSCSSGQSCTA